MTDLFRRSDATQEMAGEAMPAAWRLGARREDGVAEAPLWLTLAARWTSAGARQTARLRRDRAMGRDDGAYAPG